MRAKVGLYIFTFDLGFFFGQPFLLDFITFFEPMAVNGSQWTNIEDPTRFRQNYRAQSLTIEADDSVSGPVPIRLQDQQGTQQVPFSAINTTSLEIKVVEAYLAEEFENNRFDELAIDEIVVIGRPVTAPTGTTVPADSSTRLRRGGRYRLRTRGRWCR